MVPLPVDNVQKIIGEPDGLWHIEVRPFDANLVPQTQLILGVNCQEQVDLLDRPSEWQVVQRHDHREEHDNNGGVEQHVKYCPGS